MFYDAIGRLLKSYMAYYDQTPSEEDVVTFAVMEGFDALMTQDLTTGEVVMQQSETTYDNGSNAILQLIRDRFHDATGYGELTDPGGAQPKARVAYVATWPDALGRPVNTADYGTNSGSVLARPSTAPARSSYRARHHDQL
jgi:hypothetical protein